jgi:DNA-binding XRE family transcriptional regulator
MIGASFPHQMTSVGDRIRERRLELGLSQRALASEGVSYAYISRFEASTRRPSTKALRKLAPKLAVSVYWLETGKQDPAEQLARRLRSRNRVSRWRRRQSPRPRCRSFAGSTTSALLSRLID